MSTKSQVAMAERLLSMHQGPGILVLPNAWDPGSARLFEHCGFEAIATTSAGVAFSLGLPDGQRIARSEMLTAVRRIAEAVDVPVTADMEAGYGVFLQEIEEMAAGVIASGAVGLNFEDANDTALFDIDSQVEKIRVIRRVATGARVPLVINARTDVYLLEIGPEEQRFEQTVLRANAYRDAGADCLFVPGVRDPDLIGRLVKAIRGPLNVLAGPGVPDTHELHRLGVRRVSVGSGPMRATLGLVRRIAEELNGPGTYGSIVDGAIPYAEMNQILGKPSIA